MDRVFCTRPISAGGVFSAATVFKILLQELGLDPADMPGPPALEVTEADLAVLQTEADWLALIEQGKAEMAGPAPSDVKEEDDDDDPHEDF